MIMKNSIWKGKILSVWLKERKSNEKCVWMEDLSSRRYRMHGKVKEVKYLIESSLYNDENDSIIKFFYFVFGMY